MATFKDSEDTDWKVNIDVPETFRIKAEFKIDLLTEGPSGQIFRTLADTGTALALLADICRVQISERDLDTNGFFRRCTGDAMERALSALREAIIELFPSSQAETMRATWQKIESLQKRVSDSQMERLNGKKADEALEKIMGASDQQLDVILDALGSGSTNALAATGLTAADSQSAG